MLLASNSELIEIVRALWSRVLRLEAEPCMDCFSPQADQGYLTCCVQSTGRWNGAIVMTCSQGLARVIATRLYETANRDLSDEQVQDAVGDLCGIAAGRVAARTMGLCQLSSPIIDSQGGHHLTVPGMQCVNHVEFQCQGRQLSVSVLESEDEGGKTVH